MQAFGIGLPELFVIMVLTVIVVGPDKLPEVAARDRRRGEPGLVAVPAVAARRAFPRRHVARSRSPRMARRERDEPAAEDEGSDADRRRPPDERSPRVQSPHPRASWIRPSLTKRTIFPQALS